MIRERACNLEAQEQQVAVLGHSGKDSKVSIAGAGSSKGSTRDL